MKIKVEKQKRKNITAKYDGNYIKILIPKYLSEDDNIVKNFIKNELRRIDTFKNLKPSKLLNKKDLIEIINRWQKKIGINPVRIQIRKMKNKWSSCSSKGNITLNSEIKILPRKLVEYIIVHELLHIIVPNHNKTFKVLLSTYLPDWEGLHLRLISYSFLYDNKHKII